MARRDKGKLSRRESEMMDIVYELGEATAAQVRAGLAQPPTDAAVRATLRILVEKGHLQHKHDGPRYVYYPTVPREKARVSALRHLVRTFFDGSAQGAFAALLELEGENLDAGDRERLKRMIDQAWSEGR